MSHLPEDISTTYWYLKPVLCLWLTQSMFRSIWTVNPSPSPPLHQQNNNYQHWNMHINNIYSKHWPIQPLYSSREPLSDLSGQVRNDTVKNECVKLKQLTVISYIPELQCSYNRLFNNHSERNPTRRGSNMSMSLFGPQCSAARTIL